MKLGFITCDTLEKFFPSDDEPLLTHDDQVAANYLRAVGYHVQPVLWGTSPHELRQENFTALIMRSPWNYSYTNQTRAAFMLWVAQLRDAGIPIVNDPDLMLWSLDKIYLSHLEAAGVQTVPTNFIESSDDVDIAALVRARGPLVIKPAIGAGGKDLQRFMTPEDVDQHAVDKLREGRRFLIQPYVPAITDEGEWSLVYFADCYSHAVHKRPGSDHWLVQDELGGTVVSGDANDEMKSVADKAIAALGTAFTKAWEKPFVQPVYARVDLLPFASSYAVSELELVEPELFFLDRLPHGETTANIAALARFHESIEAALHRG